MAKELPYYKHEPSEWLEGEIQICSDAAIVCFTNLKDGYWLKLGIMSYAFALHKYCRKDKAVIKELIDNGIVDVIDNNISISFLDKQLNEFQKTSAKRTKAANKRWSKPIDNQDVNASVLQVECKSNAIREDKIRENKRIEENIINKKIVFNFRKSLLEYGFKGNLVDDWLKVRKTKKATNTETSLNNFLKEIEKKPCDINNTLEKIISKDWKGFKWQWLENENNNNSKTQTSKTTMLADKMKNDYGIE